MDKYRFNKSYYDIVDPIIIKGSEIKNGTTVEIIATYSTNGMIIGQYGLDGINKETVVHIEDVNGNIQSTYRSSLLRLKDKF